MKRTHPHGGTIFWKLLFAVNAGGAALLLYLAWEYRGAVRRGVPEGVAGAWQAAFSLPVVVAQALFDAIALLWWRITIRGRGADAGVEKPARRTVGASDAWDGELGD